MDQHLSSTPRQGCTDAALLNDWHVIAYSAELAAGQLLSAILLERELVCWRDSAGSAHVWEDLCVHRGARLSKGFIQDDKLICPYHGWNYDGTAQCVLMPAAPHERPMKKAKAIAHAVQEKYGFLWVCLGTPANGIPVLPEWDDPSYKKVLCGPYRFESGYRAIENFTDPTHFPFVHAGVNGILAEPDTILPYEVSEGDTGLATTEVRVTQPYGDPRNIPVIAYYAYRIMRPFVAYFKKRVVVADPAQRVLGSADDRFCTYLPPSRSTPSPASCGSAVP